MPALRGLSETDINDRRERDGPNELPTSGKRGMLVDIINLLLEPMSLLLLTCGGIYAAVGDRQEAFMLLGKALPQPHGQFGGALAARYWQAGEPRRSAR